MGFEAAPQTPAPVQTVDRNKNRIGLPKMQDPMHPTGQDYNGETYQVSGWAPTDYSKMPGNTGAPLDMTSTTPGYNGATTTGPQGQTAGYQTPLQWSNPTNPYAGQQATDSSAGQQNNLYAQSNIQQLTQQSNKAAQTYPAMPNSYGLGAPSSPAPSPNGPVTDPAQDNGSRGFNPWSLVGEATARGA